MPLPASLRPLARAAGLALLALAASACELRLAVDVDVDRNGGGTLAVSVAADAELQQRAAGAGADPLTDLAAAGERLRPDGWRTTDTTDDGVRTVTLSAAFDDPPAFEALAADLAGALATDEVVLLEPLRLTLTPDEVRLRGAAGLRPTRAVADYGLSRRRAVRVLGRSDALDYVVTATLPGEVLSSTATAAGEGSTLTWRVPVGGSVRIDAVSTRPEPPVAWLLAAGTAGLATAAGLVWLLSRRRAR